VGFTRTAEAPRLGHLFRAAWRGWAGRARERPKPFLRGKLSLAPHTGRRHRAGPVTTRMSGNLAG
jgi:hypothetical protein